MDRTRLYYSEVFLYRYLGARNLVIAMSQEMSLAACLLYN